MDYQSTIYQLINFVEYDTVYCKSGMKIIHMFKFSKQLVKNSKKF